MGLYRSIAALLFHLRPLGDGRFLALSRPCSGCEGRAVRSMVAGAETFGQAVLLNRAAGRWRHDTSLMHLARAGKK